MTLAGTVVYYKIEHASVSQGFLSTEKFNNNGKLCAHIIMSCWKTIDLNKSSLVGSQFTRDKSKTGALTN